MKQRFLPITSVLFVATAVAVQAQQPVPTTQPSLITIYIEEVKLGMEEAHTRHEAGWPAAFTKARAPETYLALESMTGTYEVWYTQPFATNAAQGEAMKRNDADPVLSAELNRLWREDAQYLVAGRQIQLMARPDLSFGSFPDLSKARFWEITTFRVRPGHESHFDEVAKLYGEISKRLAPNSSYRVYMVTAGMPGGTYMIFSSVNDYAEFDQMLATGQAVGAGMTAKEREAFEKFSLEAVLNTVTNRYRLSPTMSYVDEATKAADPAFWNKR